MEGMNVVEGSRRAVAVWEEERVWCCSRCRKGMEEV